MNNQAGVVIGIDGGGSNSRAMVADRSGQALGYAEAGPASIYRDDNAANNVQQAVRKALAEAGRTLADVRGIAAGIAGYDAPSDLEWVAQLTAMDGLDCPQWHFNDTIAAHWGALLGKPGIIAISGTGSNILAVTEQGRAISNFDLQHYAASAARFIAYDAVHEVLAGRAEEGEDCSLIAAMCGHWGAESLDRFREMAWGGWTEDRQLRDRQFGLFAPVVTEAAMQGGSLARTVCGKAVEQLTVGIEMLSAAFSASGVDVALIGSVINSPYIRTKLSERLAGSRAKRFNVSQPHLSPAAGAVLYALFQLDGREQSERLISNLRASDLSAAHTL